jgi:signal transduction histidine kinase/DNA-binding response OmpR family regulator
MKLSRSAQVWLWLTVLAAGAFLAATFPAAAAALFGDPARARLAIVLLALAIVAQHFPLVLAPGRTVTPAPAVYFAAALQFGPAGAALLVAAGQTIGGVSDALRRRRAAGRLYSWQGMLFNAAQRALSAAVGGGVCAAVTGAGAAGAPPLALQQAASLWAVPAAAAAMYLANTFAVAVMVGLQRGRPLFTVWWEGRRDDALQSAALYLVGLIAAATAGQHLWVPLAMSGPAAAIYLSLRRTLQYREAAEAAEREQREKGALLNSTQEGIFGLDLEGRCTFINPAAAALLGYGPNDLLGRPMHAVLHPACGAPAGSAAVPAAAPGGGAAPEATACPVLAAARDATAGRSGRLEDVELWRADGSTFPASYSAAPIVDDGHVSGTVVTFADLTTRKLAETALRLARDAALDASRAKSAFLANMSHEIRTPMNAILGMAELLAETPLTADQREYVGMFQRAGDALLEMLNDILDLSKVESGQLELESQAFDPTELLEDVAEVLAVPAHAKGLELICDVAPGLPACVVGDAKRLRQVLLNLLGNAVKFTERGEVSLHAQVVPDPGAAATAGSLRVALGFVIRDTGIGIPADKLAAIFDPFTQADASTTRRYGGTGLGLAIVKRLVGLMGGTIRIDSVPGEGSTFTVLVPLAVAVGTGTAGAADPQGAAGGIDLSWARVLVVDDHAANRLVLNRHLTALGASVDEAGGGAAALTALRAAPAGGTPYDLVLLDRRMPDLDGFDVIAQLRQDTGSDAAVIARTVLLLTSDERAADAVRAEALGLAGTLVKPVRRAALLAAATVHCRRPGRERRAPGPPPAPSLDLPPALAPALAPALPAGPGAPHRRRLLLADDSTDNRRLVQLYLRQQPYDLTQAEDGAEALAAFRSGAYDLVLMDVHMPVLDGLAATRAIRAWEREQGRPPTPIVALTASAMPEDVRRALEAGCDAHLAKPVKKQILLAAIERYAPTLVAAA